MPRAEFGRALNIPTTTGTYIKLKQKGESITFRIAGTPHYETKHWVDGETVLCGKFNSEDKKATCAHCDAYQQALELAGEDKNLQDKAQKMAPKVNFYYPVLDLVNNKPAIFQFTAAGIHYTISGYAEDGVDVFEQSWKVIRTELPGKYYDVRNLGIQRLTAEQEEQFEKAQNIKIKTGVQSSSIQQAKEPEDVPQDEESSIVSDPVEDDESAEIPI